MAASIPLLHRGPSYSIIIKPKGEEFSFNNYNISKTFSSLLLTRERSRVGFPLPSSRCFYRDAISNPEPTGIICGDALSNDASVSVSHHSTFLFPIQGCGFRFTGENFAVHHALTFYWGTTYWWHGGQWETEAF